MKTVVVLSNLDSSSEQLLHYPIETSVNRNLSPLLLVHLNCYIKGFCPQTFKALDGMMCIVLY